MTFRLYLVVLSVCFCVGACSKLQRACTWTLNADVQCRTCDTDERGRTLTEYFDRDTNELRMFITTADGDFEIQHPHKRARSFSDGINENKITFDNEDENSIYVNGEKLPITPISGDAR